MAEVLIGDCRQVLPTLPERHYQAVITSPPFWQLRRYLPLDHPDATREIGLEPTIAEYVVTLVSVFRELHRVLRDDGVVWLNLGDKRANDAKWGGGHTGARKNKHSRQGREPRARLRTGLAPGTLAGVPWRVALALIDDVDERGRPRWALLNEVIWHKREAMPERVTKRLTTAHEPVFLLAKAGAAHYFDALAIAEPASVLSRPRGTGRTDAGEAAPEVRANARFRAATTRLVATRNARTVWPLGNERSRSPHRARFPTELAARCLLASTAPEACGACGAPYRRQVREELRGEVLHRVTTGWSPSCRCGVAETQPCRVLDPFAGSGTVLAVAEQHGRAATGIDLCPAYEALIDARVAAVQLAMGGL